MKPVIGVLGGMGPRATVRFEQMLIDRLEGRDQDIPTIISLNDGSIPDRSKFLLGQGANPVPKLRQNLRLLEAAGASVVCIPCNTACAPEILTHLRPARSRIINLPEEVVDVMQRKGCRTAMLLATSGTILVGTYQELCTAVGIACIVPDAGLQQTVMDVIDAVKRGDMAKARLLARTIAEGIDRVTCDTVILGCTELPLVQDDLISSGRKVINTLAVLADACVSYTNVKVEEAL